MFPKILSLEKQRRKAVQIKADAAELIQSLIDVYGRDRTREAVLKATHNYKPNQNTSGMDVIDQLAYDVAGILVEVADSEKLLNSYGLSLKKKPEDIAA